MGRPQAEIDVEKLLAQMDGEIPQTEMAKSLGVSLPTLRNKIDLLRHEQGIILECKSVENLRVIRIKTKLLDNIERDLNKMEPEDQLKALNVLNKMDKSPDEDPKVKGLLGLLTAIEEEAEKRADEKVEERELENKTFEIEKTEPKPSFPNL